MCDEFFFFTLKSCLFVFQVCQTLLSDRNLTEERCGHQRLPECTDFLLTFKPLKLMTDSGTPSACIFLLLYSPVFLLIFIIVSAPVDIFLSNAQMRRNLENMTERSSIFRDYRLLLDGSFNFLLLTYLMQREHTLCIYVFVRYLRDCNRTSVCCMSLVLYL